MESAENANIKNDVTKLLCYGMISHVVNVRA